MAINRKYWSRPLTSATRWQCPACGEGSLALVRDSLKFEETRVSKEARDNPDWEPDWIGYRFVALLKCDNDSCQEVATVHGDGGIEPRDLDPAENPFVDTFYPRFVSPSPNLFEIAERCPADVATKVRRAFISSWGDYDACANQIRVALELLLDKWSVPRYARTKNGERTQLSLHARIDKFAKTTSARTKHLADLMRAVKWLGNTGSHASEDETLALEKSDIFDAFDLFQYVVDELYSKTSSRLVKLARRINLRKGPARPRPLRKR